jgi:hypothetical protein
VSISVRPSILGVHVPQAVAEWTFTLSGKTNRSLYGPAADYVRIGLFASLGSPPDWPVSTAGTFNLSSKTNRMANNLLGRISAKPYATVLS